jgi:5-methylcytosine-specific restriction endonuclease McrA
MASNPRRANGWRRDAVVRRVMAEESDCWLCGEPVDRDLMFPHPGSPEVDEVVPVSLGGNPFDRGNCRLAHRLCNQQRGNGTRRRARVRPLETSRAW